MVISVKNSCSLLLFLIFSVSIQLVAAELVIFDPASSQNPSISASGQDDAEIKITPDNLTFSLTKTDKTPWPGIKITADANWQDLSNYGYVEVIIENPQDITVPVSIRLDDHSKLLPSGTWITENFKLKPHEKNSLHIYMNDHSYGQQYILQRQNMAQILVFGGISQEKTELIIKKVVAAGDSDTYKPNFKAKILPTRLDKIATPNDNFKSYADDLSGNYLLADFTSQADTTTNSEHKLIPETIDVRTKSQLEQNGLLVKFPTDKIGTIRLQPKQSFWDLSYCTKVDFFLTNISDKTVNVSCGLYNTANPQGNYAGQINAEIAANSSQLVSLDFTAVEMWRSFVSSSEKAKISDAASERQRAAESVGGSDILSDLVDAVGVSAQNADIVIKYIVAGRSKPVVLPDWSGQRPPVAGDWVQTFSDDFSHDKLNDQVWNTKMPWVGLVPRELQRYSPENVFIKDGLLHLAARKELTYLNNDKSISWIQPGQYSSAVVTTYDKFSQKFGYFETRLKLPVAKGLWPAFWAMPYHGAGQEKRKLGTTSGGVEIDIFEHPVRFGPYRTNIATHWDNYGPDHKKTGTSRIYYTPDKDGFITSGLLWEAGKLTWYVNQKPVASWESENVPTVPIYLKFTVHMGGWGGFLVEDDKLAWQDFVIDYVKVWQNKENLVTH